MRHAAVVDSARGLVPFGHLGWAYVDRADFSIRAAEYLRDGLEHGQYMEYVGAGSREELRAQLAHVPWASAAITRGQLAVNPIDEFYVYLAPGVVDPTASVGRRVTAVHDATEAGWTGFRAVVDATPNAVTPRARAAFTRFEFGIDAVMATSPVSALCAYDSAVLGAAAEELVCLHPFTGNGHAPFRLFTDDGALALDGDPRPDHGDLLTRLLSQAATSRPALTIDLSPVRHLDDTVLLAVDQLVRRHDCTIVLRRSPFSATPATRGDVGATVEIELVREQVENLRRALQSRDLIGQAKGILMASRTIDEYAAFDLLRVASQTTNRKLVEVAQYLIDTGELL